MFTKYQLQAIADMCRTEMLFLELTEQRGVPTAQHQATVAAVRAIALELSSKMEVVPVAENPTTEPK